jgi:hypothetical protein
LVLGWEVIVVLISEITKGSGYSQVSVNSVHHHRPSSSLNSLLFTLVGGLHGYKSKRIEWGNSNSDVTRVVIRGQQGKAAYRRWKQQERERERVVERGRLAEDGYLVVEGERDGNTASGHYGSRVTWGYNNH